MVMEVRRGAGAIFQNVFLNSVWCTTKENYISLLPRTLPLEEPQDRVEGKVQPYPPCPVLWPMTTGLVSLSYLLSPIQTLAVSPFTTKLLSHSFQPKAQAFLCWWDFMGIVSDISIIQPYNKLPGPLDLTVFLPLEYNTLRPLGVDAVE